MLDALHNSLLSIIYPQHCRVCSREVAERADGVACDQCWAATRIFDGSEMLCEKCGAFLGEQCGPAAVSCHRCDDHDHDKAVAAGVYEKALATAITALKSSPTIPGRLRSVLLHGVSRLDLTGVDLIVPVPLAKERLIERGFNQAELIAHVVSAATSIPIDGLSLMRKLHKPIHRAGMDRRARQLSVQNAFEVVRPKLIDGKKILLVDDVFTSGATASACAKTLKKNGAGPVIVFTIARAVLR